MIKRMLEKGWNPQVNIVVFDNTAWAVSMQAAEAYKAIRDLHPNVIPRFASTNVFDAIRVLREIHRDGRLNCIVFMSDMLISDKEAEALKEIINRRYRNSPALIISISTDLPKEIEAINRYRNAAAASVKTAEDMRKVEEAIKKISSII
jgi:chemotaxis response regulator CheB